MRNYFQELVKENTITTEVKETDNIWWKRWRNRRSDIHRRKENYWYIQKA